MPLLGKVVSISVLLGVCQWVAAEPATPKGELVARGCEAMQAAPPSPELIPFTASFGSSQYAIGDGLSLAVKADEAAYVTIIDRGSDANAPRGEVLYEDVPLPAGKELLFPEQGYRLTVQGPVGSNLFEIRVAREPGKAKGADGKNVRKEKVEVLPPEVAVCHARFLVTGT